MKKIIISLIMILISVQAYANPLQFMWQDKNDKWTLQDTILEISFGLLLYIDAQKTWCDIKNNPDIEEANPFLTEHPSASSMFIYGSILLGCHTGISYILPSKYRTIWQSVWIGVESHAIYKNILLTTSFKF